MLRFNKAWTSGGGHRPRLSTRLQLEALEDRWMPTVAAPILTAAGASATTASLTWNSVAGATGYLVDEYINGAWQQIANFTKPNCTITGLSPNTVYYFDVGAYDASGTSWSAYRSATTLVAAPTFTLKAAGTSQVNMSWNSVAGATGYQVEQWVSGAWKIIGNFANTTTSCYVPGLTANTQYYFSVGAYYALGTTWANYQSVTTAAATMTFDHPAAAMAYSPVNGTLFGANGPSYMDVRQGEIGDCWLMSSLAATAARAPQDIRNMFTYQGTAVENGYTVGVYTVRFFDTTGIARYVTVDTMLPGGGTYYDRVANGVLWVALAEKAYVQANAAGWVTTGHVGWDSYAALDLGAPYWALHAITGSAGSGGATINPTSMAAAWNAGQIVTLISTTNHASPYIVSEGAVTHVYALVGYNPASSTPFLVYNPWGTYTNGWALLTNNGQQVYGLFNASGTFLTQNFGVWVTVAAAVGHPALASALANWVHMSPSLQATALTEDDFSDRMANPAAEDSWLEATLSSKPTFAMQQSSGHKLVDAVYAKADDWESSADVPWQSLFANDATVGCAS